MEIELRDEVCGANEVGGVELVAEEVGLVVESDRLELREHQR
jgi:hypothetical protein